MNSDKPKFDVVIICGPTGVGKTSVAIKIAKMFDGEIIGADSMQIYKYMDIGTAKPTPDEQACIPHHMIDIVEPDEPFDAAKFAKMARKKIMELHQRKIMPFVVGGTGLYIKSLTQGMFRDAPSDPDIRRRLKQEAALSGSAFLHERLGQYDPETAERLHPNDIFRIVRALEVYEITGRTISDHHREHRFADAPFNVLKIGLHKDREMLYHRIESRVDAMIEQGLSDEVGKLFDMGYSENLKSMQSIGYRHIADFLRGRLSYDEALRTLKRDTRRYAKRQLTWFKADSEIEWRDPEETEDILGLVSDFVKVRNEK
ncbi:tRNA (adenosine(37)-N6)-dimethylallyltransferase MiaA [Desulfonema magnum]|uniref:tRNA dimethylallyltransferase n=1 Tax=Desulfonema magnum TaxID=45655 RepID=A0A975BTH4_9BACT|nr:tRNA (adenosine(37)-N6)-dimethylallyltransferase MiaA [Desulfonema magnum]QTA91385.1 tRNA dimethylallyltransferase [Desulfonema magnum]